MKNKGNLISGFLAASAVAFALGFMGRDVPAPDSSGNKGTTVSDAVPARRNHIIEYGGADEPAALARTTEGLAKQGTLFVMFHLNSCEHCRHTTMLFNQAIDHTDLSYRVLRVDVSRYSKIRHDVMKGLTVPESHVYYGGSEPDVLAQNLSRSTVAGALFEAIKNQNADPALIQSNRGLLLIYMKELEEWRRNNLSFIPTPTAPVPVR